MLKKTCLLLCMFIALASYADEPLFKVETTVEELPQEFYDLDPKLYETHPKRPYEVVLMLANDIGNGDDYGHTHELKLVGVTKLKSGIRLKFSYTTDLYTQRIGDKNEDGLTPQHFMDETLGRLMVDNIDTGRLFYWKGELGWHQLSDVPTSSLLVASTQQALFHKLIDPINPQMHPLNLSNGYGRHDGVMAGASVGIQKKYNYGQVQIRPQAEIGVSKSSLKDSDHTYASVAIETTYVIRPELKLNLVLESQAKRHYGGTQYTHSANSNLEAGGWVFGAGVYVNQGILDNHTRYNITNRRNGLRDPIYMLYGIYWFGNNPSSATTILRSKEIVSN